MTFNGRYKAVLAVSAVFSLGIIVFLTDTAPKSNAGAARALAARIQPGERVVFVDAMLYDLPVVANLKEPVVVASDWDDGTVTLRDNWRKELYESARFAPALGEKLLWPLKRLGELACGDGSTWFVSRTDNTAWIARVPGLEPVYADDRSQLLRAPPRACAK